MTSPAISLDLRNDFLRTLNGRAGQQLKELLEDKHLYQRVSFELELNNLLKAFMKDPDTAVQKLKGDLEGWLPEQEFTLSYEEVSRMVGGGVTEVLATIVVKNVKLFCEKCDGRETFAPIWYDDLKDTANRRRPGSVKVGASHKSPKVQVFCFLYQCLNCFSEPEAFIVRRDGYFLSLHGRSPMEHPEVPKDIPRKERHFFADAVLAMQAGKTLAALFYLRTFIEQFARRQTGMATDRESGDIIMSAYADTLPQKQRDMMPSLREWYGKLSDALHSARVDEKLFEDARQEIERHFEFRRMYRIPDTSVPAK